MKKIVIFVILAAFAGGVGYYAIHNKQSEKSTTTPSPAVKVVKTKQMQAAEAYLRAFTSCMKNPPEATMGGVGEYCQSHNAYAAKSAPVVCDQNPPKSASAIRSTEINENQAIVIVNEDFGTKKIEVLYQMQRENSEWKVGNIVCPK